MNNDYRPRDPAKVSANMARIRRQGSKMERRLGSAMWRAGLRYRKQHSTVGRPDFAFPSAKVAVFCDSEFWHGANWSEASKAEFRKNREFWIAKIERTIARDAEVNQSLAAGGWRVLRFWSKQIEENSDSCVEQVKRTLLDRKSVTAS